LVTPVPLSPRLLLRCVSGGGSIKSHSRQCRTLMVKIPNTVTFCTVGISVPDSKDDLSFFVTLL